MPTRLLFVVQLLVGGFLLLRGIIDPMLPPFQLDDTLTPEEIRNVELRTTALDILHPVRRRSGERILWILTGGIVSLTPMAGLVMASRSPGASSTFSPR